MSGIFIYAEKPEASAELICLAKELGQSTVVIALNAADAEQIAQYGANQVFWLKGTSQWPEDYAPAIVELLKAENAEMLLVGASVRGRDIAASVAARMHCGLVSDVVSVKRNGNDIETTRMMYGGAVVQTALCQGFNVITVPPGKYPLANAGAFISPVLEREVEAKPQVDLLENIQIEKQGVDLAQAKRVVCIGLGLEDQNELKMAEDLCESFEAALACTRPIAEEKGWLPADSYIGISGKSIRPELYVGIGVSGQVQHTVGIRDAKIIVAVNNNEKAPIFRIADYGIVGDLKEILPVLTQAIKKA